MRPLWRSEIDAWQASKIGGHERPAKDKGTKPGYQALLDTAIPKVALPEDAGSVRVIAGDGGQKGPPELLRRLMSGMFA